MKKSRMNDAPGMPAVAPRWPSSPRRAAVADARRSKHAWEPPAQIVNAEAFPLASVTLHTPVLPRLPWRIRRLVRDTYAANGGTDRMTLNNWRDAERQIKERIENERQRSQRLSRPVCRLWIHRCEKLGQWRRTVLL